jgi:hypothetical protein
VFAAVVAVAVVAVVVDDDDEVSFARWKKQLMQKGWWK